MTIFRHSTPEDVEKITEIAGCASDFLRAQGIDQWQKGYPDRQIFLSDTGTGLGYVLEEDGQIAAVCAITFTEDPSYREIFDGQWLTEREGEKAPAYAAIHRMAVNAALRGKGYAGQLFENAASLAREKGMKSIRIDTHEGNLPMQSALKKAGFIRCGRIFLQGGAEDGDPRIAFEKLL